MKRKRTNRVQKLRSVYYLPVECWEVICKQFLVDEEDYNSLSLVSKKFLSLTNHFRFSLTIIKSNNQTTQQVVNFIRRFPNLTSLHLCGQFGNIDNILHQISTLTFNLTSLKLSKLRTMPVNGLLDFSLNINKTLTSLTCSYTHYLTHTHMFLITDCFPNLQLLDFNHCDDLCSHGIGHVLRTCRNITHLNLAGSSMLCRTMNFQVSNLQVLNLSYSTVDDLSLNVISNTCPGILQLLLEYCHYVKHDGVNSILQNCTQLTEINLNGVTDHFNVDSMVLLRPSLTKITLPHGLCWVP